MANKRTTRTSTQLSTFGTDLGSIVRLDFNKFNAFSFSFVLDKTLQLEETPIANPIIHSNSSSGFSNTFEIFHNNFSSVKTVYNLLADVMICPSHKPLLFSRQLFQKSLGASSAFALEFTSQELEFPFNLLNLRGVEELSVRSDCEIMDSQVHTENSVRTTANGAFLGECEQEKTSAFIVNSKKTLTNFPIEIFSITFWNSEWNFDSSFDCRYAQNIIFEGETSGNIISNRAEFDNRFSLSILDNSTSLFDTGDCKLSWKSNLLQFSIDKRMELNVISNSFFPSLIHTDLHSSFVDFNSLNNFGSCFNSNLCSGSHKDYKATQYLNLLDGIGYPKCPFT